MALPLTVVQLTVVAVVAAADKVRVNMALAVAAAAPSSNEALPTDTDGGKAVLPTAGSLVLTLTLSKLAVVPLLNRPKRPSAPTALKT